MPFLRPLRPPPLDRAGHAWLHWSLLAAAIGWIPTFAGYAPPSVGFLGHVLAVSLVTFFLYGSDKKRARGHASRISETNLLGFAFAGGALGALLGMRVFRHKTKQGRFRFLVPLFLLGHVALLLWLGWRDVQALRA